MKRNIFLLLSLFVVVACSPTTYTILIEKKTGNESPVDFKNGDFSIVTISKPGDKDSVLLSHTALGMAERMETDMELDKDAIPVFSISSDKIDISNKSTVPYLLFVGGSSKIIALDSLKVGDYIVLRSETRNFFDDEYYFQTQVYLPFVLTLSVFNSDSLTAEYRLRLDDSLSCTLLSDEVLDDVKAIAKVHSSLSGVFKDLGKEIGGSLYPQWVTLQRIIIAYQDEGWLKAYQYAHDFEWDKAMDIWLKFTDSGSPKKSACAAYNIAVACEMLEMNDLANKWLDRAQSLYHFSEIDVQRKNLQ